MVFYGVLEKVTDTEVTILNMRLKKKIVLLDSISELYFDIHNGC
jgi:hypothetical protein